MADYKKITELTELSTLTGDDVFPVVDNNTTTFKANLTTVKNYIQTGNFVTTGNITAQNLTVNTLTANTQIIGNTTTVSSTSNFIDIQTDGSRNYPISDNNLDVGIRMFYYNNGAPSSAALVWKNPAGSAATKLVWYGSDVGNAATTLSAGSLGSMEVGQLFVSNATATTGASTGALQVVGGTSIGGNLHVATDTTLVGATTAAAITASGNITSASTTRTGFLQVNNSATIGTTLSVTGTATVGALTTTGNVSTTSNISAGNISTSGITSLGSVSNVRITGGTAGYVLTTNGSGTLSWASNPGANIIIASNVSANSAYFPVMVNAVGSAVTASADTDFSYNPSTNTLTATNFSGTATQAKYADLAEKYTSDAAYIVGTVVVFGGSEEITTTDCEADTRVAGVISAEPAYLMNSDSAGLAVALRGKVPVNVIGTVEKGDLLVTSNTKGYATSVSHISSYSSNAVFAKSLENDNGTNGRTIWAVIL